MNTSLGGYFAFDDYHLSIDSNETKLYAGHHQVHIKPDEARVLRKLFEHRDKLVEKTTLLVVLGTEDEGVLRKVVLAVRKALNDPLEAGRIIKTERGKGYRFVADAWPVSYEVFQASINRPPPNADRSNPEHAGSNEEGANGEAFLAETDKEPLPLEIDARISQPAIENDASTLTPNLFIDLSVIRKSVLKCSLGLGIGALAIHFLVMLLARLLSVPSEINPAHDDPTLYVVQAIIAGLFLLFLFTPMGVPQGKFLRNEIARDTFHRFLKGWSAIWVSWFLLYLYLGVVLLLPNKASATQHLALQITVDFLNISNSAAFFYLFLILDMPRATTTHEPEKNKEFQKGFTAVIAICFAVFFFSGFSRANPVEGNLVGTYVSGLLVAISMAYVFGRLDSHYMSVNRWMLAPLYLYAVIQVSGPELVDFSGVSKDTQQRVFFSGVLVLKTYFFMVVYYWLQNGHFERYFNTASERIKDRH